MGVVLLSIPGNIKKGIILDMRKSIIRADIAVDLSTVILYHIQKIICLKKEMSNYKQGVQRLQIRLNIFVHQD